MTLFLRPGDPDKALTAARRASRLLLALAGLTLALFVVPFVFMRTANAKRLFLLMAVSVTVLGWACVLLYALRVRPLRNRARHLRSLAEAEPGSYEGVFTLQPGLFQIPSSALVRRVRLEDAENAPLLNLDEDWLAFAPPDGARVRVVTARKFITGIEVLSPASEGAAPPKPSRTALRRLSGALPFLCLWIFGVLMVGGFIYSHVTDAPPAQKLTIYVDGALQNEDALAAELETVLEPPLRMVKVLPFSHAMFDSSALRNADWYLVPEHDAAEFAPWFGALPESLAGRGVRPLGEDGPEGLPAADPADGVMPAAAWVDYAAGGQAQEKWYLFFGVSSPHAENKELCVPAAERFLQMN